MPIGVFDSGLGGLTVLARLRAALPGQAFVYFGDNRNAPIGARPPGEIIEITRAGVQALFDRGCGLVILACNTASAVALRPLQDYFVPADRRVLGVFVPMIEVVTGRDWADRRAPTASSLSRVALFATQATVASGAFEREVALRATGAEIAAQACPGLVDALEAADPARADALVRGHARALLARMPAPQAAILGCTHYPLAGAAFRAHLPRETRILSQGEIVAASLCDYLRRRPQFRQAGACTYLTSGDPARVGRGAALLLGADPAFRAI